MMEKIYSKIKSDKLLHIVVRKDDLKAGRTEVVSEEHFIQCALLNMEKNKTGIKDTNGYHTQGSIRFSTQPTNSPSKCPKTQK